MKLASVGARVPVLLPFVALLVALLASGCLSRESAPRRALLVASSEPHALDPTPVSSPAVAAEDHMGRASLYVGLRALSDDDFYEPVEYPFVFGGDYARRFWPGGWLAWETALFVALDADREDIGGVDVDTASIFLEGDLGLRALIDIGRFQLFAGAGAALIVADIEQELDDVEVLSEGDFTVGPYVHAGSIFYIGTNFYMGMDLRAAFGTDVDFDVGADTDADYVQGTIVLGWGN